MARFPSSESPPRDLSRRRFTLALVGGTALSVTARVLAQLAAAGAAASLPREVAGIGLPDTSLASAAAELARAASPPFLFNHCMRTFVFGAMLAERERLDYDHEMIFVAASLHDLGLTRSYATAENSFEMDGADAAKTFLVGHGVTEAKVELVWHAIALHASTLLAHEPAQVGLVGSGAGADVLGSELELLRPERVQAVLKAFPRLSFNTAFRDLLVDHCHRKPFAQRGTWLDAFCRAHNTGIKYPDLEARLLSARVGD